MLGFLNRKAAPDPARPPGQPGYSDDVAQADGSRIVHVGTTPEGHEVVSVVRPSKPRSSGSRPPPQLTWTEKVRPLGPGSAAVLAMRPDAAAIVAGTESTLKALHAPPRNVTRREFDDLQQRLARLEALVLGKAS